ncbi:MAG: hypothetical protein BME94_03520 [Methanobacteriales archaeon Met13]
MPVDKVTADSILDTYRNMYREVEDKGASGEAFMEMKNALERMEQLALDADDIVDFTTRLTTEDLFIKFSNAYSSVLAASMKEKYAGDDGDELLMKNTLEAYRESLKSLTDNPNFDKLSKPIQELIDLGESGITYPVFLRIAEEKGLNQALQGDVVVRDALIADLEFAKFMHLPLEVEMHTKILKKHDQLAAPSPFQVADSFELGLERQKIEWEYSPPINKWNLMIRIWGKMLENVYDWLDSYGNFAPHDDRWLDSRGPSFTQQNIKRTQECNPGILKAREQIFQDYFQRHCQKLGGFLKFLFDKQIFLFSFKLFIF